VNRTKPRTSLPHEIDSDSDFAFDSDSARCGVAPFNIVSIDRGAYSVTHADDGKRVLFFSCSLLKLYTHRLQKTFCIVFFYYYNMEKATLLHETARKLAGPQPKWKEIETLSCAREGCDGTLAFSGAPC
jgi:hypothetical protein